MPRKVRSLISDLQRAGFVLVRGGKGSHRKFQHANFRGSIMVSGHDGDDAQYYQEKLVKSAIEEIET